MDSYQVVTKLGSGSGYLYETNRAGSTIYKVAVNDEAGARWFRQEGQNLGTLANGTKAVGRITVDSVGGASNFVSLTIDGVAQTAGSVAAVVGDTAASAQALGAAINAHVASPIDFRAEVVNSTVFIFAPDIGNAANGLLIALTTSGTITTTEDPSMEGGSVPGNGYDESYGLRLFMDPTTGAVINSVAAATEVTDVLTELSSPSRIRNVSVTGNEVEIQRDGTRTVVILDGGGTPRNVGQITVMGAAYGDTLLISGQTPSITFKDVSAAVGSSPNIELDSNADYASTGVEERIELVFTDDGGTDKWVEKDRSRNRPISDVALRNANISVGESGVSAQAVGTSGTVTLTPGTDSRVVALTGTVTLVGNWILTAGATPVIGEPWEVYGEGSAVTLDGNDLNIFGILVPEDLALSGRWKVSARWDGSAYISNLEASVEQNTWIVDSMIKTVDGTKINAASIPTAAYGANSVDQTALAPSSVGTTELQSGSVTASKLDTALLPSFETKIAAVPISSAQVLTLNSIPVQLVAAPGAGKVIQVLAAYVKLSFNTFAYAGFTDLIIYSNTGQHIASELDVLPSIADSSGQFLFVANGANILQLNPNNPLFVTVSTGNPTVGDSDIKVYVTYQIITE